MTTMTDGGRRPFGTLGKKKKKKRCASRVPSGGPRPEQGLSAAALELGHDAERLPAAGAGGGGEVVDGAEEARGDPGAAAQRGRVRRARLYDDPPLDEG